MTITRRRAGALLASASVAGLLAGCGAKVPPAAQPSQIATDVELVAAGLTAAINQVVGLPIPAATIATLKADLAQVQAAAQAVAASVGPVPTASIQSIVQAVQAIADIVLPMFPATMSFVPVINAALSMLPALLAAVGIKGLTLKAQAPKYSAAEARLILAGAH